jgi:hypothetical protein
MRLARFFVTVRLIHDAQETNCTLAKLFLSIPSKT